MHFCSNKKLIAEDKSVKRKKESSPHTAEISKGYCGYFTSLTKHV